MQLGKIGLATGIDVVEVNHRGPGALPAAVPLPLPVFALRVEEIAVVAILFARPITLTLQGFGLPTRQAKQGIDATRYFVCLALSVGEIMRGTRADARPAAVVEQRRRFDLAVYDFDQPRAFALAEKVAEYVERRSPTTAVAGTQFTFEARPHRFALARQHCRIGRRVDRSVSAEQSRQPTGQSDQAASLRKT